MSDKLQFVDLWVAASGEYVLLTVVTAEIDATQPDDKLKFVGHQRKSEADRITDPPRQA